MNRERGSSAGAWLLNHAPAIVLGSVALFWLIDLSNLDRYPPVHEDEPWIFSVAVKFGTQGVYGSDLFTGFYGMEHHYAIMPPLYPILQSAAASLFGFSLFAVRYIGIAAGTLTIPLTFEVARRLANTTTGLLSVLLLLTWQVSPGGGKFIGTGLPLVDVSRIARFDIFTAPLDLLSLWFFISARRSSSLRYGFLSGVFAGLAALTQVYGFFWIGILLILLLLDGLRSSLTALIRNAIAFIVPIIVLLLPWAVLILSNRSDFLGQLNVDPQRFSVDNPSFYLQNVLNESNRYLLGIQDLSILARAGFWVLVIAVPAAIIYLLWRALRRSDRPALWLFVPSLLFPVFFATLVENKNHLYIISFIPLLSIALGWALSGLLGTRARLAVLIGLALMLAQSALSVSQMEFKASQTPPAEIYFAALDRLLPVQARVIGHPQYWLALKDTQYRSFVLPFFLSDPAGNRAPIPFGEAMARIAPQFVLVDPAIQLVFENRSTPYSRQAGDQFNEYMRSHNARLVQEIDDNYGTPIQIYRLDQSSP